MRPMTRQASAETIAVDPDTIVEIVEPPQPQIHINGGCSGNGALLLNIAKGVIPPRFPAVPSEDVMDRQEDDMDRILRRLDLPSFNPKTEEDFEQWVDQVAKLMKQRPIAPILLQKKWISVTVDEDWAEAIRDADVHHGYEEMVDQVARLQFPFSDHLEELERMLLLPSRKASVREAAAWLIQKGSRFLRLAQRIGYPPKDYHIGHRRMLASFKRAVPAAVAARLSVTGPQQFCATTYTEAINLERVVQSISQCERVEGVQQPIYAAQEQSEAAPARRPSGACFGCGELHFRKDCPYREHLCVGCGRKGHLAKVCPRQLIPDGTGGAKGYIQNKAKGGAEIQLPGEGSRNQNMDKISRLAQKNKIPPRNWTPTTTAKESWKRWCRSK